MESYFEKIEEDYGDIIREVIAKEKSSPLGKTIGEIGKIAELRGIKRNKARIRDAIMVYVGRGDFKIKEYAQKRLEVIFEKKRGEEKK